jgi:hypothetical protein
MEKIALSKSESNQEIKIFYASSSFAAKSPLNRIVIDESLAKWRWCVVITSTARTAFCVAFIRVRGQRKKMYCIGIRRKCVNYA